MKDLLSYQIMHSYCLSNETWLPLPNLDNYFFISNLGRVKSIDRLLLHANNKTVFYKGRIYKPQILKYRNDTVNDYTYELKVGISYLGKNYNIRVARMVYSLFVAEITKTKHYIGFKDGNNLNVDVNNLLLISPYEKAMNMVNKNRCKQIFTIKYPDTYAKISRKRSKAITQFTLNGQPIQYYPSIKTAAESSGLRATAIVTALKGEKMVTCGGFLWKYGTIVNKIDTSYASQFLQRSGVANQYTKRYATTTQPC